jgi:type I restriction enzyme S subunit
MYWTGPIPWASVKDFAEGQIELLSTEEQISVQGLQASATHLIPANTPIVCTRMAVGRVAVAPMEVAINQDLKAIFPARGVATRYLLRLADYAKPKAEAVSVGSTVKGIKVADYLNIEVPLAPPDHQSKIAEILDTLDAAIRGTEAVVAKLRAMKQGLLHDLLTRGIDANGDLRSPQPEAPHLYKQTPLGWLPKEWGVVTLEDAAESIIDGPFGSNLKTAHYVETPGVRVVRLQNIQDGYFDDTEKAFIRERHAAQLARNEVLSGDVLIASLGDDGHPVGRSCLYPEELAPAINKADCFRLRGKTACRNGYAMLFLNGETARRQARGFEQGVTMKRINLGNLRRMKISLPKPAEQQEIEARSAAIDATFYATKNELDKLRLQKSGLMDDLLTGRVPVTPLL